MDNTGNKSKHKNLPFLVYTIQNHRYLFHFYTLLKLIFLLRQYDHLPFVPLQTHLFFVASLSPLQITPTYLPLLPYKIQTSHKKLPLQNKLFLMFFPDIIYSLNLLYSPIPFYYFSLLSLFFIYLPIFIFIISTPFFFPYTFFKHKKRPVLTGLFKRSINLTHLTHHLNQNL